MTENPRPQLSPEIRALLDGLRRRIRRYVWLEGLAAALVWLGAAFWGSLAIDWFFEPPVGPRVFVLAAAAAGLVWVLAALIGRRAFVPLRDANMAMLLERRFPQFRDSLLTSVELAEGKEDLSDCNLYLLSRTCQEAARPLGAVRLGQVFNPVPLRRAAAAAAALGISIILFGLLAPEALGVWARRTLAMSTDLWPRKNHLELDGFEDGVAKIAKGSDLEIVARADLNEPHVVPDLVEVYYREGGVRSHKTMNRDGTATPGKDAFQAFSYTFHNVLTPISFDVTGGDCRLENLRIEVVDNPTIVEMVLECEYPKYMARSPGSFPFTSLMQFPVGSRLTLRAKTNKDLVRVQADAASEGSPKQGRALEPDPSERRAFQYTLDKLAKDTTLLFTLFDTDGIKSREPVRVTISALEDQRPELAVQLKGIGQAITPQAQLPASGRATDDHGLARLWFEYAIDQQKPATAPIAAPPGNATEFPLNRQILDVRKLNLKPGQKFLVCVKAEDRCDLGRGPNVGTSDRWQLEVVTPEQLRTMLQTRELVLRQRFEAIIKDVVDTRDTLMKIDFGAGPAPGEAKLIKASARSKVLEPGEKEEPPKTPEQLAAQRRLQVQWAAQNSVKDSHEVLGVADAVSDIREELINNRIDTEELKRRLQEGIAEPLRSVAQEMFPELDRRLERLQTTLGEGSVGEAARARAVEQADAIVAAMRQVLSRMVELEDFNEAVELLKAIIQAQEKVNVETKQRHKERLRDLLEE